MYVVRRVFFAVTLGVMLHGSNSNASNYFEGSGYSMVHSSVETAREQLQHSVSPDKGESLYYPADLSEPYLDDEQIAGVEGEEKSKNGAKEVVDTGQGDDEHDSLLGDSGNTSEDGTSAQGVQVDDVPDDKDEDLEEEVARPGKVWRHRRPAHPVIEIDDDRDGDNTHIPNFHTFDSLYKNAFHCAGSNNVQGLVAVLHELADLDKGPGVVLEELRTKEGDNLLLYAVKHDAIDTVRFLLYMGSDVNVTNRAGETPLEIAVSNGKADMINVITEMQVGLNVEREDDDDDIILRSNTAAR